MSNTQDLRDIGAIIPSYLDDWKLDPMTFRLYAHIARRAGSGICWESVDRMAEVCQMNRKTAYKSFAILQDLKMILVERRKGQTSVITLTSASIWQPAPNKVQVKPIPNQGQPYPKAGIPPVPNQVHPPVPDQAHPPVPNQVHKGIPIKESLLKESQEGNIYPDRATQKKADRPKLDQPKAEEQICIFPEKQEINFLAINENAIEDRSSAAPLAKPKKTRKANECDFEVFREVWNSDRPSHWSECKKLDQDRVRMLKRFTDEHGDRSMEIFQNALLYAQTDKWCRDPKVKLSINNFMSNGKPLSYSEKLESQQNPSGASANQDPSQQKMARDYARIARVLGIEEGVEEYAES